MFFGYVRGHADPLRRFEDVVLRSAVAGKTFDTRALRPRASGDAPVIDASPPERLTQTARHLHRGTAPLPARFGELLTPTTAVLAAIGVTSRSDGVKFRGVLLSPVTCPAGSAPSPP